jgi:PPOX class probable F420-dependent enzyme
MTEHFSNLTNHQFISLATFRKSGAAVATPVWFAQDGDRLVMTTDATSGKVKRIRNNPHVEVAPSDMRGKALGNAVSAQARILQDDEATAAEKLLKKKYGLQWKALGLGRRNNNRIFLEITPQ